MIQIPKIDIYPYWELVKRRKWWIIIPFFLVTLLGGGYIATSPKVFRASTLILVEAQRVPSRYVKSTISQDLRSRLHTITQQIKSRSYLKKVIKRYDLTKKERSSDNNGFMNKITEYMEIIPFVAEGSASQAQENEEKSMYSMVKLLRNKIDVSLHGSRNSAFEVSFEWHEPEVAANVANALASQFIEQNLNLRSEMAMGTTDFLSLQVRQLRKRLQEKEKKLENFRNEHLGSLPSQLQSNLNILNQLKEEKNNLLERLDRAKKQASQTQNQLDISSLFDQNSNENNVDESNTQIDALKNKLETMKSKYTEKHPDVIALQNRIKSLKKSNEKEKAKDEKSENNVNSLAQQENNKDENSLQIGSDFNQSNINSIKNQIAEINEQIEKYQKRVEKTPKVEIKLKDLQRNYETVKERYENLLAKKLDAEMAEELEKRQKGEQFKVIDSAIPPRLPFKPDVGKLGFMTLVLGLGMGGGLAYLRETLDPAFYTAEDAENQLGRKVITSLPWEETNKSSF